MTSGQTHLVSVLDRRSLLQGIGALTLLGGAAAYRSTTVLAQETRSAADRLAPLLQRIPTSMIARPEHASNEITWLAPAAQFAALGTTADDWLTDPTTIDAPFGAMVGRNTRIDLAARHDQLVDTYGFSPLTVEQVMTWGAAPINVAIYNGGLNRAVIESALATTGYEQDGDSWTVPPNIVMDETTSAGSLAGQDWGTLTFLDDDTILTTRFPNQAQAWLAAMGEEGAFFADERSIPGAFRDQLAPDCVNFFTMEAAGVIPDSRGDAMRERIAQSDDAVGPLRYLGTPMISLRAGALPAAAADDIAPDAQSTTLRILVPPKAVPEEIDEKQIAEILLWRIANLTSPLTDQPYIEMFGNPTITVEINDQPNAEGSTFISLGMDNTTAAHAIFELYTQGDIVLFSAK